jgi:hypothetical protein
MNSPLSYIDPTGLACYPLEKLMFGSCAPFMNNGVAYGANWNEFDILQIILSSAQTGVVTSKIGGVPVHETITYYYDSWSALDLIGASGFTLGVRAPGETWTRCMSANSGNYSIAGAFNLQSEGAKFALGNDVSQLLFGDKSDAAGGLGLWEGGSRSFEAGVGQVMTAGRRTFMNTNSVPSLNLAGTPGRAAQILGKTGVEEVAEWATGLAELKMAADVGLTGAQAIGCGIHR